MTAWAKVLDRKSGKSLKDYAEMTFLQALVYYTISHVPMSLSNLPAALWEVAKGLFLFVVTLVVLVTFPLSFPIFALLIRNGRREEYNRVSRNENDSIRYKRVLGIYVDTRKKSEA